MLFEVFSFKVRKSLFEQKKNNTTRKLAKSHQTSSATIDGSEFVVAPGASNQSGSVVPAATKHRKKREELSLSATKSIKKEFVDIVITFN